jgi:hypothetical protein
MLSANQQGGEAWLRTRPHLRREQDDAQHWVGLLCNRCTCGQSSGTRGGGSLPRMVGMMPVTISSSTTPKLHRQAEPNFTMCSTEPTGYTIPQPLSAVHMKVASTERHVQINCSEVT